MEKAGGVEASRLRSKVMAMLIAMFPGWLEVYRPQASFALGRP